MRFEVHRSVFAASDRFDSVLRLDPGARPRERFPWSPDIAGAAAAAAAAGEAAPDRQDVVARLVRHNEALGHAAGADEARRLLDPRAVVVTAGQQPGFLGGPMLALAKLAGALDFARRLEAGIRAPVVPLFWCHSEDHDLDEVNRFEFPAGAEVVRRAAPLDGGGRSLDRVPFTEEAVAAVASIAREAGIDRAAPAPREGETWSAWSQRCLLGMLPDAGIVFVEPAALRPLLSRVFRRVLDDVGRVGAAFAAGTRAVAALGKTPQVETGDPSPLFWLDADGRRRRLRAEGGWRLDPAEAGDPGPDALPDRLREAAASAPERLSTGVWLRPAALQAVLPVAAHLLGPAEIAYFAQLPEVFRALDLPVPAAIPRPSLTVLRPKDSAAREELGLAGARIAGDPDSWPAPPESAGAAERVGIVRGHLDAAAAAARDAAGPGARDAAGAFAARIRAAADHLAGVLAREATGRGEGARARRRRLQEWVRPRGRWQERVFSPLVLVRGCRPGTLRRLLEGLDSRETGHHVVTLEESDHES